MGRFVDAVGQLGVRKSPQNTRQTLLQGRWARVKLLNSCAQYIRMPDTYCVKRNGPIC